MGFRFSPEEAILRATMSAVPRLRDSVRITRHSGDESFVVIADGSEGSVALSISGFDLLCRMDGVTEEREVREAFGECWDTTLSGEELRGWVANLDEQGAFVRSSTAITALSHLREQGIAFRGGRPDRRRSPRDDERRRDEGPRAQWFDHAVVLLNDGHIAESCSLFERFAAECPADVRVQELARHLKTLVEGDLPEHGERRDVTWEVFDAALRSFLEVGSCPSCGAEVDIQIGDLNRCYDCGASFSSYVLGQSDNERRRL